MKQNKFILIFFLLLSIVLVGLAWFFNSRSTKNTHSLVPPKENAKQLENPIGQTKNSPQVTSKTSSDQLKTLSPQDPLFTVDTKISQLTYSQMLLELQRIWNRKLDAKQSFQSIFEQITIDPPLVLPKGNLTDLTHYILRQTPQILAGLPAGTEVHLSSINKTSSSSQVVLQLSYLGHDYPGKKILEFIPKDDHHSSQKEKEEEEEEEEEEENQWGLKYVRDTSVHLESYIECPSKDLKSLKKVLTKYHGTTLVHITKTNKIIQPSAQLKGIMAIELFYYLTVAKSPSRNNKQYYRAVIDLCKNKFLSWEEQRR